MKKETNLEKQINNLEKQVDNLEKQIFHYKKINQCNNSIIKSNRKIIRSYQKMLVFFPLIWFWVGYWYGTTGLFKIGLIVWIFIMTLTISQEIIFRKFR